MTDESKDKGGITIRLPDKAAIAIVLALAGFAWNKVESYFDTIVQTKVDEGAFQYHQGQIDELAQRIDDLRAAIEILEAGSDYKPPPALISPKPEPVKKVIDSKIKYKDIMQHVQRTGAVDLEAIEEEAAARKP